MERRTSLVAAIATGVSLTAGVLAFAASGGATILGLGGGHGSSTASGPVVVHQVQTIEDQVVVASHSTDVPRASTRASVTDASLVAGTTPPTIGDGISVLIGPRPPAAPAALAVGATFQQQPTPDDFAAPLVVTVTSSSIPATAAPTTAETQPAGSQPDSQLAPASATSAVPPTLAPASTAAPATTAAPASPATATTQATTAARPPGVPADWPAEKPIPPMPAGCKQPQLEDNGVWNCQH